MERERVWEQSRVDEWTRRRRRTNWKNAREWIFWGRKEKNGEGDGDGRRETRDARRLKRGEAQAKANRGLSSCWAQAEQP